MSISFLIVGTTISISSNASTPENVYFDYIDAIETEDITAMQSMSQNLDKLSDEEIRGALPSIKEHLPDNITISKSVEIDNVSYLYVRGTYYSEELEQEQECKGVILLSKVNENWDIRKNVWRCVGKY